MDDLFNDNARQFNHAKPDPSPAYSLAKRHRLEQLDIRAAVTAYKETED